MKKLIHLLGKFYALLFFYKNRSLFEELKINNELEAYAESEVKNWFFRQHARLKGLKFAHQYVDTKKKSDVVFILGSGESINELSKSDWRHIKHHNIIGLNYSFVHPIVPDYHLMEMIPLKAMQDFFLESVKFRYQKTDMFFQYKHVLKSKFKLSRYPFKNNMYVHVPHLFPTVHEKTLGNYFSMLMNSKGINLKHLVHHNSHIGCAVMFAQALGYKKIVMLGIDLNGGSYFTDSLISSDSYPKIEAYHKINELRTAHFRTTSEYQNSIHPTVDLKLMKDRFGLTMDRYFKVYLNSVIDRDTSTLYVGSHRSILSKFLPVYQFADSNQSLNSE